MPPAAPHRRAVVVAAPLLLLTSCGVGDVAATSAPTTTSRPPASPASTLSGPSTTGSSGFRWDPGPLASPLTVRSLRNAAAGDGGAPQPTGDGVVNCHLRVGMTGPTPVPGPEERTPRVVHTYTYAYARAGTYTARFAYETFWCGRDTYPNPFPGEGEGEGTVTVVVAP